VCLGVGLSSRHPAPASGDFSAPLAGVSGGGGDRMAVAAARARGRGVCEGEKNSRRDMSELGPIRGSRRRVIISSAGLLKLSFGRGGFATLRGGGPPRLGRATLLGHPSWGMAAVPHQKSAVLILRQRPV
jgi:hypothetical protein